jgi:hypothetical protein
MRSLTLTLLLYISITTAFAQGNGEIDLNTPDAQLLEAETFRAVNNLRLDKKTFFPGVG